MLTRSTVAALAVVSLCACQQQGMDSSKKGLEEEPAVKLTGQQERAVIDFMNNCTREEADAVPGIGAAISSNIINGDLVQTPPRWGRPYATMDDVMKIGGIGPKTVLYVVSWVSNHGGINCVTNYKGQCVTQAETEGLLKVLNRASHEFLRTTVGLPEATVSAIEGARELKEVAALDATGVTTTDFAKLIAFVRTAPNLDAPMEAQPAAATTTTGTTVELAK